MNIFCEEPCVVCPPVPEGLDGIYPNPNAEGNPFSNFSSETPDRILFFGRNYRGTPDDPYLGTGWRANGCVGLCFSGVSQEDADLCAARQQVLCTSDDWPDIIPNPDPGGNPTIPVRRSIYQNDSQYCGFICPDGSPFYFTVIAGKFSAFSQLEANLIAYSYACNKAVSNRVCIGALSRTSGCLDEAFSTQVSISSKGGPAPVSFDIVSGALPPGLSPSQSTTTAFFSGIPTAVGEYMFTLRATDVGTGIFFMEKAFTIRVITIADEILPAAEQDAPYSHTLTVSGPTVGEVLWSLVSGTLPEGLTLSEAGVISGTPTTSMEATFTVGVTNQGTTCSKELTILAPACFDASGLVWISVNIPAGNAGSSAQSSMSGANGSFSLVCYSHDFFDSSTAQQKHFFTTLIPPGGCRVKLKINYSYTLWENFTDPGPGARLRLQLFVNAFPLRQRDHIKVQGTETASNLEWEEEFDVPEGPGRFEFRTFLSGVNGAECGFPGCPSTANGTFTLQSIPP